MHHLARNRIPNEPDVVPYHDFVSPAPELEFAAGGFGHMRGRLAVAVARIQQASLAVIERQPCVGENVLAHGEHQVHVEVNVVKTQELPARDLMHALQME